MSDQKKCVYVFCEEKFMEHPKVQKWLRRLRQQFHAVVGTSKPCGTFAFVFIVTTKESAQSLPAHDIHDSLVRVRSF